MICRSVHCIESFLKHHFIERLRFGVIAAATAIETCAFTNAKSQKQTSSSSTESNKAILEM